MNLADQIHEAELAIVGHELLTQSRCVDLLLDLYNVADSDGLREIVGAHLSAIRHLQAVSGTDMSAALVEIHEAWVVESAFAAEPVG